MNRAVFLLFLLLITLDFNAQECKKQDDEGIRLFSISKFQKYDLFQNVRYIVYDSPKDLPLIKYREFNKTHLTSPYSVLQSMMVATNNQWLDSLTLTRGILRIKDDELEYLNSKEYESNYSLKVISEFFFELNDISYDIILVFYKSSDKRDYLFPFVFQNMENKWYVTNTNRNINDFSGLFFLKPEILDKLFTGSSIENPEYLKFQKEYFTNSMFNTKSKLKFGSSYLMLSNPIYPTISLQKNKIFDPQYGINKQYNNIGIVYDWSKDVGSFYVFLDKTDNTNHFFGDKTQSDYKSSPEIALASWEFSAIEEKLTHCIDCKWDENRLKTVYDEFKKVKNGNWHLKYQHKLTFYDEENLYVQLFFKEWLNDEYLGMRSLLLRCINGVWFVDNSKSNENLAKKLSYIFDVMKPEVLKALLSNEHRGDKAIDEFVKNVRGNGELYINDFADKVNVNFKDEFRRERGKIVWN